MFDVHCPACSTRRLVFPSQVLGLVNDERGICLAYRCWCGAVGTWLTGKGARTAAAPLALAG